MSLFINQENTRTKLQQKIADDLAEKAKQKATTGDGERPDGVDDSAYLKNTKRTTGLAWAWALIAVLAVGILIWLAVASM